ncbi:DUF4255 domain-containing protein [Natrarchaeobius halalkaliphilus]|nr:DUF4255 domain-containing protein [Natrarchaeobius halalkaliphilus]
MNGFGAVAEASDLIVERLREETDSRGDVTTVEPSNIVLASPDDVTGNGNVRLSVFPYKISHEPRHGSPGRIQTQANTFKNPPLLLSCYYLVTAYPGSATDASAKVQDQQIALGLAMQILHDNAQFETEHLQGESSAVEAFQVALHSDSNDEIERIWDTFVDVPLHPSVVYEASPIPIESTTEERVTRVSERDLDLHDRRK